MRGEIENKIDQKQIKKIKQTKMETKSNQMTPLYFGKRKREKRERRTKKFIRAQTTTPPCTCLTPMEKGQRDTSNATLEGDVWW